jgi:hypothetical protein
MIREQFSMGGLLTTNPNDRPPISLPVFEQGSDRDDRGLARLAAFFLACGQELAHRNGLPHLRPALEAGRLMVGVAVVNDGDVERPAPTIQPLTRREFDEIVPRASVYGRVKANGNTLTVTGRQGVETRVVSGVRAVFRRGSLTEPYTPAELTAWDGRPPLPASTTLPLDGLITERSLHERAPAGFSREEWADLHVRGLQYAQGAWEYAKFLLQDHYPPSAVYVHTADLGRVA